MKGDSMAKILVEPLVDEPMSLAVPVARAAVEVPSEPIEDAKSVLSRLASVPGVALAVLVDREGFLIESAGDMALEAETAGALAGCLAQASEAIGRELGQATLVGLIAEYEAGVILVNMAGSGAMLATVLSDPALLDQVRSYVKKTLSELLKVA
jgi:predicted regulator of Ras-like GTPase activity (Roadblock/LC7/MglB family)